MQENPAYPPQIHLLLPKHHHGYLKDFLPKLRCLKIPIPIPGRNTFFTQKNHRNYRPKLGPSAFFY